VTETRHYHNEATQAEKREVLRDTYLTRAQSDADLTSQGRFKKEIATRVTGVPVYPSLPASSPWSSGFDQNVEPPLGFAIDEMPAVGTPNEIQSSEPVPIPLVAASPTEVDRTEEPAVSVVSPLSTRAAGSHSMKRRSW
jgi:hypothetical protein